MKGKILIFFIIILPVFLFSVSNLSFDGNDYVEITEGPDISGNITVEAWVYLNSQTDYGNQNVLQKGTNYALFEIRSSVSPDADKPGVVLNNGSWQFFKFSQTCDWFADSWHHVAFTYDGSDVKLYIDGSLDSTFPYTSSLIINNDDLAIGSNGGFLNAGFIGQIDEVRIWNTALSSISVGAISASSTGLVGYWKFDEGTGDTTEDATWNDDGRLGSAIGSDDNDPSWIDGDAPLPVVLSTFTVIFADTSPLLLWTTMSETANLGWNIYRSDTPDITNGFILNAELIEGAGTTSNPTDYSFYDEHPALSGITYWYWLETVNYSGETELHGSVTLTVPEAGQDHGTPVIPETFGLYRNYPNPFNPNTYISFALPEATNGELVIYNMKGQKIKTLFSGEIEAEKLYDFTWNGADENGLAVTSGIYFYQLKTADSYNKMQKMVILK